MFTSLLSAAPLLNISDRIDYASSGSTVRYLNSTFPSNSWNKKWTPSLDSLRIHRYIYTYIGPTYILQLAPSRQICNLNKEDNKFRWNASVKIIKPIERSLNVPKNGQKDRWRFLSLIQSNPSYAKYAETTLGEESALLGNAVKRRQALVPCSSSTRSGFWSAAVP